MKVQNVSNQNFKGNVVFINRYGKVANKAMREELTKLSADMPTLDKLVASKPYDLYISEKDMRDPWLLRVSTNRVPEAARGHFIAKTLSYYLTEVAKEVMEVYESVAKNVI